MSVALESFLLANPNPTTASPFGGRPRPASLPSLSSYLRLGSVLRPRPQGVSYVARFISPKGLGHGFIALAPRSSCNRLVVSFAAPREDASEIEVEKENDLGVGSEESEEEWQKTVASFKEQALKMQSVSQELYEVYSKKAKIILKETSKKVKIQTDKARQDLNELAKAVSEDGKEYLSLVTENSPEPVKDTVKDIVGTFSSTDELNEISKVRDFYLGIPYGAILSIGGFLSFMLTGSISAIRFGLILGGALLALSISSLRSWKKGESFALALKGQTAIAGIIFLREICLLSQRPSFSMCLAAIISGAMVAFYFYRIILDGVPAKGPRWEQGNEN